MIKRNNRYFFSIQGVIWLSTAAVLAGIMLATRFTTAKALIAIVLLTLTTILLSVFNRTMPQLKAIAVQHSELLIQHWESIRIPRIGLYVIVFSAIGLYCELMIIRWHATAFHLFAVFKNVSMFACFLGLGLGYAISYGKPMLLTAVIPMFSVQFLVMELLRNSRFQELVQNPIAARAGQGLYFGSWQHSLVAYGVILLTFTLTTITFIPLGQLPIVLHVETPPTAGLRLQPCRKPVRNLGIHFAFIFLGSAGRMASLPYLGTSMVFTPPPRSILAFSSAGSTSHHCYSTAAAGNNRNSLPIPADQL